MVQAGDSFAALARRYYGSERYTEFLIRNNPQIGDPRLLKIGAKVRIPPHPDGGSVPIRGTSSAEAQTTEGRRTYVVREGDSFYAIARDRLGDAARWRELFQLNQSRVGNDPASLRVGQELLLPE